jgi:recombination protein RecA
MNERGSWVWRKAKDLKPGDYLVALDTLEVEGSHSLPAEEAFFVGVLIADGHFAPFRVQVSNNDPAILENILQIGPQVFSAKPHLYNNGESVAVHFNTKEGVGQFYERFGFGPGTAADKKLGVFCRSLDQASTAALIKGYMDCESSIDTKGIEVTSASRLLLEEVSLTLRRFGIHGTISQKRVSTYPNNTYWRLFLSTGAAALYRDRIGTASSLRAEQLATLRSDRSFDSIPHMAGLLRDLYESSETTRTHDDLVRDPIMGRCLLTRDRLQKILEFKWSPSSALSRLEEIAQTNYKYEEVVSVKEMPPEPVFDLTTEKTHSFVANGLVTHNSTVALHVVAEAQKAGGTCAYVDAEHAVDPDYARRLGVDTDSLLFSQPDSGEQALEIVDRLVRSGAMDVIVIDSVAALVPRAELEGEMGSAHVGLQARLMSQAMRKLAGNINRAKTVCIFINQIREKVGVVYGSPEVAPGGRALKFYASVRLDLRRIETLKEGAEAVGIRVKAKVAKNKCAPPLRVCEFDLFYASGIDSLGSVLDVAADLDVVRKSGGWYSYGETKLGNGKAAARETLSNHPALVAEISDKVYRQLKGENE